MAITYFNNKRMGVWDGNAMKLGCDDLCTTINVIKFIELKKKKRGRGSRAFSPPHEDTVRRCHLDARKELSREPDWQHLEFGFLSFQNHEEYMYIVGKIIIVKGDAMIFVAYSFFLRATPAACRNSQLGIK